MGTRYFNNSARLLFKAYICNHDSIKILKTAIICCYYLVQLTRDNWQKILSRVAQSVCLCEKLANVPPTGQGSDNFMVRKVETANGNEERNGPAARRGNETVRKPKIVRFLTCPPVHVRAPPSAV